MKQNFNLTFNLEGTERQNNDFIKRLERLFDNNDISYALDEY